MKFSWKLVAVGIICFLTPVVLLPVVAHYWINYVWPVIFCLYAFWG